MKRGRLVEGKVCPDHVHILVEIPPKMSMSGFMGYLKGKSSTMLYEKFRELKYKYQSREFRCRGYYVDKVGKIQNGLQSISSTSWKKTNWGSKWL